jgi:hypothetical protein
MFGAVGSEEEQMSFLIRRLRKPAYACGAGILVLIANTVPGTAVASVVTPQSVARAATEAAPAFKVVPAPDPDPEVAGVSDVGFTAVSAASATDALAVGPNPTEDAVQGPFADHWNGTAWAGMQLPTPSGQVATLEGVADIAPGDGWAVGYSTSSSTDLDSTLIEHWNGTSWSIVPSPDPAGASGSSELDAIAAVSPTDIWAAGDDLPGGGSISLLFEHYNGTSWTAVPSPGGGFALGLAALASNNVWMVGDVDSQVPISAHWNGSSWSMVTTPSVNAGPNPIEELTAVTAVTASDVWASGWVGNVDNENKLEPIMLHWTGSAWSVVTVPNPGSEGSRLNGITSDGADDVFAVGQTQEDNGSLLTLIEQFNGSTWTAISSPDPGRNGSLIDNVLSAAGSAASTIWAVGAFNKQGDCCDLPLALEATLAGS